MNPDQLVSLWKGRNCVLTSLKEWPFHTDMLIQEASMIWSGPFRPADNCVTENHFLISQPKHMLWVLKEPSQWDGSFEHPKHMIKLMDKKIIAILSWKFLLNWPYGLIVFTCLEGPFLMSNLISWAKTGNIQIFVQKAMDIALSLHIFINSLWQHLILKCIPIFWW